MTQEDIIRMAREAGFAEYEVEDYTPSGYDIRYWRFATLVAAHEREACAKVLEEMSSSGENTDNWTITRDKAFHDCATAIRARGNK